MKSFEGSKKSWHFRVANLYDFVYNASDANWEIDSCSYVRCFIMSMLQTLVIAILGCVIVVYPASNLLAYIVVTIFYRVIMMPDPPALAFAIIASCLGFAWYTAKMITKLRDHIRHKRYEREQANAGLPAPEPSLVSTLYTNFKEKTCIKIKFN